MQMKLALLLAVLSTSDALKLPASVGRRAVVAGLAGTPLAAHAGNPLSFDGTVEYKQRNYGTDAGPAQAKQGCEEGQRLTPDGFGGKKCVGEVKSVAARVLGGNEADSRPAPPPRSAKAEPKSRGKPTQSSQPSAPALSFEELLANSIKQKEDLIGRQLSDPERKDLESKLRALMS